MKEHDTRSLKTQNTQYQNTLKLSNVATDALSPNSNFILGERYS